MNVEAPTSIPKAVNEPVRSYAPGSEEKASIKAELARQKGEQVDIPMFIGGQEVATDNWIDIHPPHERNHTLGRYSQGDATHVQAAIDAANKARKDWANWSLEDRAAIFVKASELLTTTYRDRLNAATMHCQSKNIFQAEIDSACELIDFFRFNVEFMKELEELQPISPEPGVTNSLEYRPLEGFVTAITPFNFTAIAGNLPSAPAMLGNTVLWKPSNTQVYSAWVIMDLLREAGLPDGVINLVYAPGRTISDVAFNHQDLAGIHFTGSTGVFQTMWRTVGENIAKYRNYPRIVGETGGKDFILAHPSANAKAVAVAMSRGAFEYQGQKCSAASRAYIPSNLWPEVKENLLADLADMKMGTVEDFSNFVNAVIDEASFDNIASYIDQAKADGLEIIAGGNYDKSEGYFVEPTVIMAEDPSYRTMCEEIFGPVLTVHVYDENKFDDIIPVVDSSSEYGLTGAIFSEDRDVIERTSQALRYTAGNFYINDKPTGAVVGQQPFGGARASGTNDKAGSKLNLIRWVSPRTIKENDNPPTDYRYPFLDEA